MAAKISQTVSRLYIVSWCQWCIALAKPRIRKLCAELTPAIDYTIKLGLDWKEAVNGCWHMQYVTGARTKIGITAPASGSTVVWWAPLFGVPVCIFCRHWWDGNEPKIGNLELWSDDDVVLGEDMVDRRGRHSDRRFKNGDVNLFNKNLIFLQDASDM